MLNNVFKNPYVLMFGRFCDKIGDAVIAILCSNIIDIIHALLSYRLLSLGLRS